MPAFSASWVLEAPGCFSSLMAMVSLHLVSHPTGQRVRSSRCRILRSRQDVWASSYSFVQHIFMRTYSKPGAVLGAENRSRSPTDFVSALEGISISCWGCRSDYCSPDRPGTCHTRAHRWAAFPVLVVVAGEAFREVFLEEVLWKRKPEG